MLFFGPFLAVFLKVERRVQDVDVAISTLLFALFKYLYIRFLDLGVEFLTYFNPIFQAKMKLNENE